MTPNNLKSLRLISIMIILALLLAACLPETLYPTATLLPTGVVVLTATALPTGVAVPTAAPTAAITLTDTPTNIPATAIPATAIPATAAPTATLKPTAIPPSATPTVTLPPYLDDRSTPTGLILSYFNAINRREYLRAYSYYRTPSQTVGTLAAFFAGYQNTASVTVTMGTIGGDNGAGQIYYSVPALLKAVSTSGAITNYAACYIMHLSQPGIQGAPPFVPLAIKIGKASILANNADAAAALANACSGPDFPPGQPIHPTPKTNPLDISKNNYLDERSDAQNVIKSLLNAINRKEYLRAYSYWENPAVSVGPFAAYEQGFSVTDSVEATFGTTTSDAGAGQLYYRVPVAEKVKTTTGGTQTFVGCYTLHISQPALQNEPPFAPLSITTGSLKQVANSVDTQPMLATACQQP